ncbi:MAG: S41 family peptidase [Brevinema sp.]
MNYKFSYFTNRMLFFLYLGLAFFAGVFFNHIKQDSPRGNLFGQESVVDDNYFRYYNMFRQAYKILQDEYVDVDKVDSKTLLSGAIKGMLSSTKDPYTDFLSPEIAEEFSANLNATFYGVGIRIEMRHSWLTVVAPIKGTPAAEAGLQAGDQIIEIDGESTKGLTSLEAVGKIRGTLGTEVKLTILRNGVLQPFTVSLKRAKIDIDTVESAIIPYQGKKLAYLKIIEFGIPTEKEFEQQLKRLLAQNPDSIVLDVRNNPGGLLTGVAKIADMILDEGLLVYTRGRITSENFEFRANPRNTLIKNNIPITILANQGSASASEILVGALKDTARGTVVGMKTFGKGCVQKTYPLSDGSLLKYTIAKYYTPAGNAIANIGINPDITVGMWYDELTDVQKTSVIQIQMTNYIIDLLQIHNNNPSEEAINQLYQQITQDGYNIPREVLNFIIMQRKEIISDNIYNLDLDMQLAKALDIAIEPRDTTKYQYFYEPKTIEELKEMEKKALEMAEQKDNQL